MRTRLDLHEKLSGIPGVKHSYFSPPEGMTMEYPCIVYHYTDNNIYYADNRSYIKMRRYIVTVIDEDPDSEISETVSEFPYCSSERNFVTDGMYHFVYILFF